MRGRMGDGKESALSLRASRADRQTHATAHQSYEQACAEHEWRVPAHYNIAADTCDKHPCDKPAIV